jgi:hypothetical protein
MSFTVGGFIIASYLPVSVDTAQQLSLEVHVVEAIMERSTWNISQSPVFSHSLVNILVPVRLNFTLNCILESILTIYQTTVIRSPCRQSMARAPRQGKRE